MASTLTIQGIESLLKSLGAEVPILEYPYANIIDNPIDIYRLLITGVIQQIAVCESDIAYDSIQKTNTIANGDLSIVIPRLRRKRIKHQKLAEDIASKFPLHRLISPPSARGHFVPIYFAPETLPHLILPFILERKLSYGTSSVSTLPFNGKARKKKVIVEFSSPNIAKEFHAGHLRSTIIGAFISNLYKSMGWEVTKINYLGDWGKQFGLVAVGWERFGSEELLAKEPLKHLLDVYARINTLFKPEQEARRLVQENGQDTAEIESQGIFAERNAFFMKMEQGDKDAVALWKRFRDISIERYISTYSRLNIAFDEYSGESTVKKDTISRVETTLKEKGILVEENGAWVIDFRRHGAMNLDVAVVRSRIGTTTYLLRDVAAVLERAEKYAFDKMIYVVSSEQDVYFQRLFKTVALMGYHDIAAKLEHVNFGRVQGMSSRLGTVELLSDILDKSSAAMHEVMRKNEAKYAEINNPDQISDSVGITSVMVQDMSSRRIRDYPFDITKMTSFEGDTGPYLQYSHARLCSIVRKAKIEPEALLAADWSLLKEPHAINIIRLLAQYSDITRQTLKSLEPGHILTYLFHLTHQVSSAYEILKVIGAETQDLTIARLALYESARQVLENGMKLLGFTPVERM
ncbi:hypothetical protein FQN57_000224 [Myotisia sp. PD_48]|nr:hypothetical protein FQN57_000224 [Myotisia sp. PD_48]